VPAAQATTSRSIFSKSVSRPTGLPAKQGLIRDFIDVVLEALAASTPTIRSLLLRRLAYLADGQQLAEDPSARKREVSFWHDPDVVRGAELFRSAPVVQTSTCSAMASATSIARTRYRTAVSIFLCRNRDDIPEALIDRAVANDARPWRWGFRVLRRDPVCEVTSCFLTSPCKTLSYIR